jgi:hypothetical protein
MILDSITYNSMDEVLDEFRIGLSNSDHDLKLSPSLEKSLGLSDEKDRNGKLKEDDEFDTIKGSVDDSDDDKSYNFDCPMRETKEMTQPRRKEMMMSMMMMTRKRLPITIKKENR